MNIPYDKHWTKSPLSSKPHGPVSDLIAENARLREALEPFIDAARYLKSETCGFEDNDMLTFAYKNWEGRLTDLGKVLTFGQFRAALRAIPEGK